MEFLSNLNQQDPYTPTYFELVATQKLRDLLTPATRYVLTVYASRYPRYIFPILNIFDEAIAGLTGVVEWHYLTTTGGSFSENFYSLKRVSTAAPKSFASKRKSQKTSSPKTTPSISVFTKYQKWGSIFLLVTLPYIKSKFEDHFGGEQEGNLRRLGLDTSAFDNNNESAQQQQQSIPIRTRLKDLIRKLHPFVHSIYSFMKFMYSIAYLYGKTDYHSPWFHLLGLKLRRLSQKDMAALSNAIPTPSSSSSSSPTSTSKRRGILQFISLLSQKALNTSLNALRYILPMTIFAFKFLEWYYTAHRSLTRNTRFNNNDAKDASTQQSIPPPPESLPSKDPDTPLPPKTGQLCPICNDKIKNPAVLSSSGFVFCYPCIIGKLRSNDGRCPVTGIKIVDGEKDVRKIYDVAA